MPAEQTHTIYTIGHSTHSGDDFIKMLQSFNIRILADIRRFPGSRKYPWFNQEALKEQLNKNGIEYVHIEDLGGRRKPAADSRNTLWRNDSFRGYADYMETAAFQKAVSTLEALALRQSTAYMCSEAVWWRCHRALVSDYLKARGWKVWHIMSVNKKEEHPYTSVARITGEHVDYSDRHLFNQ